jgi:hypothetical protein
MTQVEKCQVDWECNCCQIVWNLQIFQILELGEHNFQGDFLIDEFPFLGWHLYKTVVFDDIEP